MGGASRPCFSIVAVNLLLLSTGLCAHFRVCEPYSDHRGRHHFGFHCPRLSDNKTQAFCCHSPAAPLKYCCNASEFRSVARLNLTADPAALEHSYTALVGVWIYGLVVLALLALDFLYYSALNCEPCRARLEQRGLGGRWLKRGGAGPGRGNGEPPLHPIVLAHHPRHSLRADGWSSESGSFHTSRAW